MERSNSADAFPLRSNISLPPSKITKSHGLFFDRDFLFVSLISLLSCCHVLTHCNLLIVLWMAAEWYSSLNICFPYGILLSYNWTESRMWLSIYLMPSSLQKEGCPMISLSDLLTLLLVIFAALSYIDNHHDKKKQTSSSAQRLGCLFLYNYSTEGKSDNHIRFTF